MSVLVQIKRHVTRLKGCTDCPDMIGPVVTGTPVVSPVMLVGQAPGDKEGPAGKPFAWEKWSTGRRMRHYRLCIGIETLTDTEPAPGAGFEK